MSGLVLPNITNCYFVRGDFFILMKPGNLETFPLYKYNSKSKYRISHLHKGNGMNED